MGCTACSSFPLASKPLPRLHFLTHDFPRRLQHQRSRLLGQVEFVRLLPGLVQVLFCLVDRASQRCQDRPRQVALQVKQIGVVGRLELLLGATDQAGGLVAGEQHTADGKPLQATGDGHGPGSAVAALGVGLDQDEVGDGFDGHQADVGAMEVLVQAQGNVPGRPASRQVLTLLLGKLSEVVLQLTIKGMQGAVGGADEVVQFDQFEEVADLTEAAGVFVVQDQQQGEDQAAQEGQPGRAAEEADEGRIEAVGEVLAKPVAKGGAGDAMLLGVLALRARGIEGVGEVGKSLGGIDPAPAARGFRSGVRRDSL
jgi:hypothetical protein